ncbi:ADP-ribosylation factor-binding protein GGA1 [Callorhinchus milii]|uniref:ADP-ribosylation factor-binding protein GGA1 n=1 Tax=Callorhinchus milii TaxID=7868 RepID=UPI00045746B8|nr:ADP-ribosylation factor-binding protein GGA1 [Callorhinchus milii]|eukprot:gi/632974989/ref/XP_007903978.1/ PREDICTED: ADP-ribosylation factor-binding protein GGA2 [Callorhinchus milii]
MAAEEETLESWLNKATDPVNEEETWEFIEGFCQQVNKELEGPQIATRLLGHKIQSPQEREAMHALTVLEMCMNNCGRRFQNEAGKFRFLNDLIKVLSPKYLGTWSSEKVKSKIIEVLYSWTVWLPDEVKVRNAYQMLKKQGIIKQDPKLPDNKTLPPPPPREESSLFDDEEKSKLLARLLKSSHPEDLQAANRLIKNVIKEEQEKTEKVTKRVHAIEEVNNTTRLLNDMLTLYSGHSLPESEHEVMTALYQRCEKLRPTLFRFASDTGENDDALVEILQANDALTLAINSYKKLVVAHERNGHRESTATKEPSSGQAALSQLEAEFLTGKWPCGGPGPERVPAGELPSLLDEELMLLGLNEPPLPIPRQALGAPGTERDSVQDTPHVAAVPASMPASCSRGLNALDALGQSLMQESLGPRAQPVRWEVSQPKLSLRVLQSLAQGAGAGVGVDSVPGAGPPPPIALTQGFGFSPTHSPGSPPRPGPTDTSFHNLFVSLETIKPSSVVPVTVFDQHGFRVLFHFAGSGPLGRPDVLVIVISMLSTSPLPISNIHFQAAVPKVMKVKLQPASGTQLPAFNPVLPPPIISQVMLLANPPKEKVRLRYKLMFTLGELPVTEVGEVADIPATASWGSL